MSKPIARALAKELIKIYCECKLPCYTKLNAKFPEGFTNARINKDPGNNLFQMIVLAAYDREPFTRWARGFEPIWGLVASKESLPGILRSVQLFDTDSVLNLEKEAINNVLAQCSFYGHHLASYGRTKYSKTLIEAANSVDSLLSDIKSAKKATDVKKFHSHLVKIPGIGETIASKLVMYTLREFPYFGSSIHFKELYPAVKPILKEYHNNNMAKELINHYGEDIIDEVFDALKKLGGPFCIRCSLLCRP